jgi:hypothetical protein
MAIRSSIVFLALAAWILPAGAQTQTRRASMVGAGGSKGKCTIEVEVDGVAEVAVSGDTGRLRTLSGQPAQWRRFECNGQLPRNPTDFRFKGIDGRGQVDLVSDPRDRGVAVVRIEDPKGGREGYTFDLEWTGGSYGNNRGFGNNDDFGRDDGFGRGRGDRAVAGTEAMRACREAITQRISRDGYSRVNILSADADDNRGGRDKIVGRATASRGRSSTVDFDFTCNMNFNNGRVRSVDVNPR